MRRRCDAVMQRLCGGDAIAMRLLCDRADGDAQKPAQKLAQKPAQKPAQYVKVFLAKNTARYLQVFLAKYLHIVAHRDIRAAHHCAGICNCVVICLKKYLQIPNPSGLHTAQSTADTCT